MSLAIVHSRAQEGVSAPPVTVEVHLSGGLPGTSIVGLPETAVKEARDRVRVAIQNAQLDYPARRVTVSLAPADLPKDGGRLICRSRWASSPPQGTCPKTACPAMNSSANWRCPESCALSQVCCPPRSRPRVPGAH